MEQHSFVVVSVVVLDVQVVRHVLARHDPLRCAGSIKRDGVRFRGNELLGLVAVGAMEVR